MKEDSNKKNRRDFLKSGLILGAGALVGTGLTKSVFASGEEESGEKVKLLTPDGKLVEVDKSNINCKVSPCAPTQNEEARKGIPGRKFVMVIDLALCANARKCVDACQHGHDLTPDQEWISIHLMKDNPKSEPYWFPKPCYHCDDPSCVKVCPVGATFKRTDGCVLVDADRCIGCKFCISACPYSARIFNWKDRDVYKENDPTYSPETSVPAQVGTVGKCDFCPDLSRVGKIPHCASACPMGAIYFGDVNEDAITNGVETLRFEETIKTRIGYRYLENLGTKPNVYYLPAKDKNFPYERGFENLTQDKKDRYNDILNQINNTDGQE